ncbi:MULTISPECIES: cobalamin biosynthesis protein CobW [Aurantimonas]|uniref:cobalamin biosynthesis protein CobW n=1 Tax=Aurantimonas TaxID=182269 RepID=UPI00041F8B55|nr:cobalamin biosynthesis protein CobW [Aurantimonas coralicida]
MQKIPATVVTGFLGAGKTTLIRNMLQNAGGRKIALIINEFGDLGVDGDILTGCGIETCTEDDVVELTNGCICCTVADDFIPTMTKLLARDRLPDHIVIETSGLALPQPLVAAFNWPEVKTRVTVDGVVTVIDTAAVAAGRFADDEAKVAAARAADESLDHDNPLEELFEDQIRAADLIVLNKADLVDAATLERVRGEIGGQCAEAVKIVTAEGGVLPTDVLLGLSAGTEDLIGDRKSHHELHHEGQGHDHDHDEFESFVVEAGQVADPKAFADGLSAVIAGHDILRLKGFADVPGKPMRLVVQAVGQRIETYFDRPWKPGETRATRLVVIGLHDGLDAATCGTIQATIRALTDGAAQAAAE